MNRTERRLRKIAEQEVAAYRREAARRSPESLALVRRQLAVGPIGHSLGLDTVAGVVWVRVADHGGDGVVMPVASAIVEVWGGKPADVFRTIEANRPVGVLLVPRWYPATWWVRLKARARWWLYRLAGRRGGR